MPITPAQCSYEERLAYTRCDDACCNLLKENVSHTSHTVRNQGEHKAVIRVRRRRQVRPRQRGRDKRREREERGVRREEGKGRERGKEGGGKGKREVQGAKRPYISPPLRAATKCSSETNTEWEQSIVIHNAVCLPADKEGALITKDIQPHPNNLTKWKV